ncbi:MAG: DNA polymerase III subunit delta [Alistipes sp.]
MAKGTAKFKDAVTAFEQQAKEVAARHFAPIYLLMGEEGYFIDTLCDQLASTILGEAEKDFNQMTVYGRDTEVGQVINLCRQMPMMGAYQVVIVKEAQQMHNIEKLSLYTAHPAPTTILIICHKEKNVDKRSQFYKTVAAQGVVLESVRPRDYEITGWLTQFIASRGCSIEVKALSMLTDYLGTDISKIANELQKLLVSIPVGTKKITDTHIEQNIGISKDFNNFELCKAVLNRDIPHALMIADHFAHNPKDNPLLVTIISLFSQFKELFILNYLRWRTVHKGIPFPQDAELMRLTKLNSMYVIGELQKTASKWPNKQVFGILGLLRTYDAKSKGVDTGGVSNGELLRELLLKIFMIQ